MSDRPRRGHAIFLALFAPFALAQPVAAQAADKDLAEISAYTLTMPKYQQYLAATQNLTEAAAANPESTMEGPGSASIDEIVAKISAIPPAKSAITSAGLTVRDFVLMQGALLQTGMAYGMMKQFNISKDSVVRTAKVNPANLDFYANNEAEIKRLAEEADATGE
jgi:hypothetical protein